jgi:4-hydroxythreonine-4-phosphate dehydrogenase
VSQRPLIAVTSGEPAGVGPELCGRLAGRFPEARLIVLGDRALLSARADAGDWPDFAADDPGDAVPELLHLPLAAPAQAGRLDTANAGYVIDLLDRAIDGCLAGEFAAMVTAPVHKGVIADSGRPFTGHTEYLAARCRTKRVVMMLTGGGLRVALVTTHLPLAAVPAAITAAAVDETLRITHGELQRKFGIERPRILVAGLNPHAGEGGHMGREEIELIAPVLARLRAEGIDAVGPLPADTLFTQRVLEGAHAQVAMYHDQGLAVLKYASFGNGTNVTLGLPIIRTSVDHGTALDLAGSGRADPGSLLAAVEQAIDMAARCR